MDSTPYTDEQFFAYRDQLGEVIKTIAQFAFASELSMSLAEEAIALVEESLPHIVVFPGVDKFTNDPVVTEIRSAASSVAMNAEPDIYHAVSLAVETIVSVRRQQEAGER
jgi:hypothetical protein